MKREYYQDIGYKPFLFYVIFGVSAEELEVSRSRHNVDGLPEDLQLLSLSRPEHQDYIDGLLGGQMGQILRPVNPALYDACLAAEKCVIIRGTIQQDSTLDYMRNVIGIIEAFFEKGAVGVLDPQTISMYSQEIWQERFFGHDVNAQNHVVILFSEEEGGYWLHTRGMAEFGRPDIGISGVPKEKADEYKQVIDQMVFYSGHGIFFKGNARLHIRSGKTFVVSAEFIDDFDNEDYNNAYYNVTVKEES
ncbi:MAG: hypothetical protein J5636_08195 [Clostridiales bacterium]|nr:hypothetical protein [Clostridiales bacterium]